MGLQKFEGKKETIFIKTQTLNVAVRQVLRKYKEDFPVQTDNLDIKLYYIIKADKLVP